MLSISNIEQPKRYSSASDVPSHARKLDILDSALTELFFIEHPQFNKKSEQPGEALSEFLSKYRGSSVWVYYPWSGLAIHVPAEDIYFRLRTARNRNLINENEQKKYHESRVGIAGLSVGSSILAALVSTGGPKYIKIADPDTLEITNLNRIRATLLDIGQNKTDIAARNSWEVDPFLDLELWREGITKDSLESFLAEPRLDIFVDEMDAIDMKIISRERCRSLKVPVIMGTDNGDSVIVDVERFDLEPGREIFHGQVHFDEKLDHSDPRNFVQLASKIIDPRSFTERQQESILEVGKTLSGIPQLGSAAMIVGAAVAYVVRQITNNVEMPSGRYVMGCDEAFKLKNA